jgi:hypothetical protein
MSTNGFKYNSHYAFGTLMVLFFLLPLWMSIYWYLSPNRKLVVAIVDKSLFSEQGQQHVSLNWVLGQEKFSKTDKQQYQQTKDYYGFFASDKKKFVLKGLERFSPNQLEQLSKDADLGYFTNSYGVFKNDGHGNADQGNGAFLQQTGMSAQDFQFLSGMKAKGKLVIVEFNALAPPTSPQIRSSFESLYGIKWTGWIGRYFDSFDSSKNKELPAWLIKDYRAQHKGVWPFKKGGIAFVHADKTIVILEEDNDLTSPYPEIMANKEGVSKFHLKESIPPTPIGLISLTLIKTPIMLLQVLKLTPTTKGQLFWPKQIFPIVSRLSLCTKKTTTNSFICQLIFLKILLELSLPILKE